MAIRRGFAQLSLCDVMLAFGRLSILADSISRNPEDFGSNSSANPANVETPCPFSMLRGSYSPVDDLSNLRPIRSALRISFVSYACPDRLLLTSNRTRGGSCLLPGFHDVPLVSPFCN